MVNPLDVLHSFKKVIDVLNEAKITDDEIVSFISVSLGIMHNEEPELYKITLALAGSMEIIYVGMKKEEAKSKETQKPA